MKNNDGIPTTDTTEIKQLINRVKQGELDQGAAQLIEKLLSFLLTIVSLLQRKKNTSIRRMKDLLFGMEASAVPAEDDRALHVGERYGRRFRLDRLASCARERLPDSDRQALAPPRADDLAFDQKKMSDVSVRRRYFVTQLRSHFITRSAVVHRDHP